MTLTTYNIHWPRVHRQLTSCLLTTYYGQLTTDLMLTDNLLLTTDNWPSITDHWQEYTFLYMPNACMHNTLVILKHITYYTSRAIYVMYIVHIVHCTHCTLYTLYILHIVHCTHCTLYILYIVHCTHCSFTLYNVQCTVYSTICPTWYNLCILL